MKIKSNAASCKERKERELKEIKVIRMGLGKKTCRRAASVGIW